MDTPVFGRVDDPADIADYESIEVSLAGYTADREEVVETFQFRATTPTGAALQITLAVDAQGNVALKPVLHYLRRALLPEDRERWDAFLDRDDLRIDVNALLRIYEHLAEQYSARPTLPRSASPNGRSSMTPTSQAAARSRASTSRRSRTSTG